jgi:predicted phosphodiesterase
MSKKRPAKPQAADLRTPAAQSRQEALERFQVAVQEAAEHREVNRDLRQEIRSSSSRQRKVREMLIADLIRVFNHPDNPYAGWAASEKRYRDLGHFPEILVTDLFGTHAEFQRAAGLREKRGTAKMKLAAARLHTEGEIRAYAEEYVLRSAGRWQRRYRSVNGIKHVLVGSDFHGQFVDPLALRVFLDVAKDVQPDTIVLNGDVLDFPQVSRFTHMPGAGSLSLQDELDWVRDNIVRRVREAAPKAAIIWTIGNHEHRLVRHLANSDPAIASLRSMSWTELLDIDEYEVEMCFGGNFMAPTQRQRRDNYQRRTHAVLHDCFVVTHGQSIAQNAPMVEARRWGMSGTSGHTHRPQVHWLPSAACPSLNWTSTPMMAGFAVGKDYVDGPSAWTMGFGLFTVDASAGVVTPQLIPVYEDFATFSGHVWRATDKVHEIRRAMWGEGGDTTSSARKQ